MTARLKAAKRAQVRVFLVDDHPLVRQALRDVIEREPDMAVCGEAADRQEALAGIDASKPDLVILDLTLRNSDGLDVLKEICCRHPKIQTLILSMYDETLWAERAIRAGASGYISKVEASGKVIEAIRKVLSGEIYWSEKVAAQVASKATRRSMGAGLLVDPLSERELEVFELIGSGASVAQITSALHIGASTVETYRMRIKEKLNLKDGSDLLQAAIRWHVARNSFGQTGSGANS